MGQLQNALYYAQTYGWKLFPCRWDNGHKPYIRWKDGSTDNYQMLVRWARKWPDCYYCVDLRASNVSVLDIDNKAEKDGSSVLYDLIQRHSPLPIGLKVHTPNNGYHLYFNESLPVTTEKLGKGLDTPVMVPIPSTHIPGKGDYAIIMDDAPAPIPPWIKKLLGVNGTRPDPINTQVPLVEQDLEHNIKHAAKMLFMAEPAVQGAHGDAHTYKMACTVRDYGISAPICYDLMAEYFNPHCLPPWSPEELQAKIQNAYSYAHLPPGSATPEADFAPVTTEELAQADTRPPIGQFKSLMDLISSIKPPAWLVKKYIEMDTVTLWYGESGSYKSFLAIDLGMCIAMGQDWANRPVKQGPVFFLAGEGHGGIRRRLKAWMLHNDIDSADAETVPFYVSGSAVQLDNKSSVNRLRDEIKVLCDDTRPSLIIVDTLATSFGAGDENSAKDMTTYLTNICQGLRAEFKCSILIIHHTGHKEKDRARGSYALLAGVDAHYKVERVEKNIVDNDIDYLANVVLHSPGKMKDGEPPKPAIFSTRSVQIGVDEDLESITSLALTYEPDEVYSPASGKKQRLGKYQEAIIGALLSQNCSANDLRTQIGNISLKALKRTLKSMQESCQIVMLPSGEYSLVRTGG